MDLYQLIIIFLVITLAIALILRELSAIRKEVGDNIWKTAEMSQRQFSESSKTIREVSERLVKLDDTNRQVLDFSSQLESLQDTLKNPKHRGLLGEYYLETLLKNSFSPKHYATQYAFRDGKIVDAVIFFGDKIIPIDSKFSLETYNQIAEEKDLSRIEVLEKQFVSDLKKRIDETAKYIRPEEGTMEFAFMFIPAEGIYYDLLVNKIGTIKANTRDLLDYAVCEKNVHIVSPTTFYVTLQSLIQGMRAYSVQSQTKEIIQNVSLLKRHLKVYEEHMQRLGNQLSTGVKTYNTAVSEFGKIEKDITKLTGESSDYDVSKIEDSVNRLE